jgi:hypothetical protein
MKKRLSQDECDLVEAKILEIEAKVQELVRLINGKVPVGILDQLLKMFGSHKPMAFQMFKVKIEDEMYRARMDRFCQKEG